MTTSPHRTTAGLRLLEADRPRARCARSRAKLQERSAAYLFDRLGEPADTLVDLVDGHRRVRQAQRAGATLEQEVAALDDGDALFHRGREELVHVDVRREV